MSGDAARTDVIRPLILPVVAALLVLPVALQPARAETPLLAEVLQNTAVTPPASVPFREERHSPMLREPLVLTGHFAYLAAGEIRKSIETPFAESYLVADERIVIERDCKTRSLSLNRSRLLRSIFTAIEAILAGRAESLDGLFSHEISGSSDAWVVQLTPLSRKLARQLEGIRIDGNATAVTSIRIDLGDDEWQRMEILSEQPGS